MSQTVIFLACFASGLAGGCVCIWLLSRRTKHQIGVLLQAQTDVLLTAFASVELSLDRSLQARGSDPGDESARTLTQAVSAPVLNSLPEIRAALSRLTDELEALGERNDAIGKNAEAPEDAQHATVESLERALQAQVDINAEALRLQAERIQSILINWTRELQQLLSATSISSSSLAGDAWQDPLSDLGSLVANQFELQRQLIAQRQEESGLVAQQVLERMPQVVQKAIQVELEFQTQSQSQRDAARLLEQRSWQRDQDNRRDTEMQVLRQALAEWPIKPSPVEATAQKVAASRPALSRPVTASQPPLSVSARPPELEQTPLPRKQSVDEPEDLAPELSDEELDAMPPELPASAPPKRRVLPAPKKPVLRNL